jgi:hypothetical protein
MSTTYSTGVTLAVGGTTFTVTNVTLSFSDVSGVSDPIDVSHLGQSTGSTILTIPKPLKGTSSGETGKEISFDYIGTTQLAGGTTGTYSLGGPITMTGNATVLSSSVTLALQEVVRGSATVRLS